MWKPMETKVINETTPLLVVNGLKLLF